MSGNMNVRDKFWLFASRAHDDDIWLGKSHDNRFTRRSRITPAEGAAMLDVPNVIMITSDCDPAPYSKNAYGYMDSFCRMQNVVWSVVGSGGCRMGNEEQFVCELAKRYPNVTGAFADDFISMPGESAEECEKKLQLAKSIRATLDTAVRPMSMWLTVYTHNLLNCDTSLWDMFDAVSLWTWSYEELRNLQDNFKLFEEKFPQQKKYLGIYLYDYPSGQPVPVEYMQLQCEYGLSLLKEKRIDGMIFLTNCVMGVGLPSEYWLRNWIDQVKNMELP